MDIVVCIKQVPGTTKVNIEEETGSLIRAGVESKLNPYDLYALEAAMKIKESLGCTITALTMGPPAAREILEEAFMLGADRGYLLSDKAFAGSDVLATSRALAQCLRLMGDVSLIICGKQTTDGDTAQVGPAIAEHLDMPHVSWVKEICHTDEDGITLKQDLGDTITTMSMNYPCLITVETSVNQPRLPSYLLKKQSAGKEIITVALSDLSEKNKSNYGILGSPTSVERIFTPVSNTQTEIFQLDGSQAAQTFIDKLKYLKFWGEEK